MGQFGITTRKWLLSVISQRKLLLKTKKSHKSELHVEMALEMLDNLLSAYSYENDLYMARFINKNSADINILLPGKGSSCFVKRQIEFSAIIKQALLIDDGAVPLRNQVTQKPKEYELLF